MSLNKENVNRIYQRFGYEVKGGNENIQVYIFRQGIYNGADIVTISGQGDTETLKEEYSKMGYACRVCSYETEQQIEEELFRGFFAVESASSRLKAKYSSFIQKQSSYLGANYQYIPCPFRLSNSDITEEPIINNVLKTLNQQGPQLLILEAAAGYGKTCTAYEVLNELLKNGAKQTPLITELSRNRQAKIFRYVLLDEIDQEYPALSSDLVQYEIQSGRIPLIIDGFDELLYKQIDSESRSKGEVFEEVESMLDTIGQLLKTNAKIILTTRRTAIFSGEEFSKWMEVHSHEFNVTRFLLEEPDIEQWLGSEKVEKLLENDIPIIHLANPVLLAFLKNLDNVTFDDSCKNSEIIIQRYFSSLLNREQERQAINLSSEEQLNVFKKIAGLMLEFNITSESREFFRDMILAVDKPLLEKNRLTYPVNSRPTVEQLAETLSNHALLNKTGNESAVSFINEFIFGILLGESICDADKKWVEEKLLSEQMIELASTAYKVRSEAKKGNLWEKISIIDDVLDQYTKFSLDISLRGATCHDFFDSTFDSLTIHKSKIGENNKLERSTFINSTFNNVTFDLKYMREVGFLNCTFNKCSVINTEGFNPQNIWEIQSTEYEGDFLKIIKHSIKDELDNSDEFFDYERKVLENFWKPGREHADITKPINSLVVGFKPSELHLINAAIESLKKQHLIYFLEKTAFLNREKMNEIRSKLGR